MNFDERFTYVLAGAEGTYLYISNSLKGCGNDQTIYEDALRHNFRIPPGSFYLGDAGYALSPSVLTPYPNTRYHLKEWGRAGQRPANPKELFNLRHSQLRVVIERSIEIRFDLDCRCIWYGEA